MQCAFRDCPLKNNAEDQNVIELKVTTCPSCKIAVYCSERCQRNDWTNTHRISCDARRKVSEENFSESSKRSTKRGFEDYEMVTENQYPVELGRGSYGSVRLVRDKSTGEIFALKVMSKKDIKEYSTAENVKREIKIQKKINHPHIIRLMNYFEDKDNVYLVLEYAKNGNLFNLMRRKKKLPEVEAFVYFFQTCLGVDYLHKMNIIHRDIKPENLLLDENNNIKVCDFGWSAEANSKYQKRTTFCGTIDYMAPEMIQNQPHDASVDIWCLGILLYEILHNDVPFRGGNDMEKCSNIAKNDEIGFDKNISEEAKDLIRKLLKKTPTDRLTMTKIFNHPWLRKNEAHFGINVWDYVFKDERRSQSTRDTLNRSNAVNLIDDSEPMLQNMTQPTKTNSEDPERIGISPSSYQLPQSGTDKVKQSIAQEYQKSYSQEPSYSQPHVPSNVRSTSEYSNPYARNDQPISNYGSWDRPQMNSSIADYDIGKQSKPMQYGGYETTTPVNARRINLPTEESGRSIMGRSVMNRFLDEMNMKEDPEISLLNKMETMMTKKTNISPILPKAGQNDFGRFGSSDNFSFENPPNTKKFGTSYSFSDKDLAYNYQRKPFESNLQDRSRLDKTLSFNSHDMSFQENRSVPFGRANTLEGENFSHTRYYSYSGQNQQIKTHFNSNVSYQDDRKERIYPERQTPSAPVDSLDARKNQFKETPNPPSRQTTNQKPAGIYFNDAKFSREEEERVSRVSRRNHEVRKKEPLLAEKEESFFQRLLANLGCANRDKDE